MPTKSNGPLMTDIDRAIKAAQRNGWKEITVRYPNGSEITVREGEDAKAVLPAPPEPVALLLRSPSLHRPHKSNPEVQEIFNEVQTIFRTGVLPWDVPIRRIVAELARRGYTRLDGEPLIVKRLSRLLNEKGFNRQQFASEKLREKWARERAVEISQLVQDGRLPRDALRELEPQPEPEPDRPLRW